MSYLKKHRLYAIASVIALCVLFGVFLLVRARQPPEPKTVYVLPTSRTGESVEISQPKALPTPIARKPVPHEFEAEASDVNSEPLQMETVEVDNGFEDKVLEMILEIDQEEEDMAEKPVSPFGFGPYPEVPSDYPDVPVWEEDDYPEGDAVFGRDFIRSTELIQRVLIKLWSQGDRVSSGSTHDGLVLPHYPNTVYVEWRDLEEPDGSITQYVSGVTSGPDVSSSVHDAIMDEGVVPSGITVLDPNSDGIDPYTFLNQ